MFRKIIITFIIFFTIIILFSQETMGGMFLVDYTVAGTWDYIGDLGDPYGIDNTNFYLNFGLNIDANPLIYNEGLWTRYEFSGELSVNNYTGTLSGFNGTYIVNGIVDFKRIGGGYLDRSSYDMIEFDLVNDEFFYDVPIPSIYLGVGPGSPLGPTLKIGGLFTNRDVDYFGSEASSMFLGEFTNINGIASSTMKSVPEPATALLFLSCLVGMICVKKFS